MPIGCQNYPKSKTRAAWLLSLCTLLLVLASLAEAAQHAVILQYHHFGSDTPPSTSVTSEQFDQHLKYLEANGFTVWPLDRIVTYLRQQRELPDRCVAITIDDAYESMYEIAWPRLLKYGWPFTVFVTTEGVDQGFSSYIDWERIREMARQGVTFAGHSHSHSYLLRRRAGEAKQRWRQRVSRDISTAMARIEAEVGVGSRLFAYPYGEYNQELKEIVLDLGLVGFGQQSGPVWAGSDFGALPRFAMAAGYAEMAEFRIKVHSLPLPVLAADPADPELPEGEQSPVLRLQIADGDYQRESLACFLSGQGRLQLQWLDRQQGLVEMVANQALPEGRSRYNCTARHSSQPRYYWYSHLWIRSAGNLTTQEH